MFVHNLNNKKPLPIAEKRKSRALLIFSKGGCRFAFGWNWHLARQKTAAAGCRGFIGPSPSATRNEIRYINECG
jgi:hypothetical protein